MQVIHAHLICLGDGNLGWDELFNLLFPESKITEEKEDDSDERDFLRCNADEIHHENVTLMKSSDVAALGQRIRSVSEASDYSDTDSDDGGKKKKGTAQSKNKIKNAIDKVAQKTRLSSQEFDKQSSEVRELTAQDRSELRKQIYNQLNAEIIPGREDFESVESDD
ncbi:hypothetical protein EON65_21600 [archaeon]|nr:MAG: hypothetical protein EON65_21600 [archaeon]